MDDIKQLVQRAYDNWNSKDQEAWLTFCDENTELTAPGGFAGRGREGGRMFWSLWQDAFPNNHVELNVSIVEGEVGMQEAVFSGRHTGVLNSPGGAIPPTGKDVTVPVAFSLTFRDGKWSTVRAYFDVFDLLAQLGVVPASTAS
jgi:ketosteroid isomerase-like protein